MELAVVQDIYLQQPSSEECRFGTWVTDSLRDEAELHYQKTGCAF